MTNFYGMVLPKQSIGTPVKIYAEIGKIWKRFYTDEASNDFRSYKERFAGTKYKMATFMAGTLVLNMGDSYGFGVNRIGRLDSPQCRC